MMPVFIDEKLEKNYRDNPFKFYDLKTVSRIEIIRYLFENTIIEQDFISNIHFINQLYNELLSCDKEIIQEVIPRLFPHKMEIDNSPNDRLVALTWFALSDDLRQVIIEENKPELFWKRFIDWIAYEIEEIKTTSHTFIFPIGTSKDIIRKYKNHSQPDVMIGIGVSEKVTELPDPKNPEIRKRSVKYAKLIYRNDFLEKLERKLADTKRPNQLEEILNKLNKIEYSQPANFNKDFLSLDEAAEYLGVSEKTMYDYNHKGILNSYSLGGKKKYYKKEEINDLITSNKSSSKKEINNKANKLASKLNLDL